jgi:adenylate cyclase
LDRNFVTGGRVERRLAAVLAADVAGYSRLMGVDEVGTHEALKAHRREVFDPTIAAHHGRIVKSTGDGLLAEFASAVDAITCAMDVQGKMAERNRDATSKIAFRIGINVGDIIIEHDDIFGDGVNVAARVENECEPGGVCLSDDAFRHVRGKTAFMFDDLGERSLKNIDRPVRIYAVRSTADTTPASAPTELSRPLPLPANPSIAVLPFQNLSGDPEQEYFADGMVEDIITALSRFKSLFVIARNSSFAYRGKTIDVKHVGRELGVRYVLEGSVRRVGDKIRITAQLIDATSGSHLWADKFDGTLNDVFEMQDSVTSSVVGAITPRLDKANFEAVDRKPAESWGSYDYYLRGMKLFYDGNQPGKLQAVIEARKMFLKSLELDPTFGRAYARLAGCFQIIRDIQNQPISEEERVEAVSLAERAVELAGDDEATLAHVVYVFGMLNGDFARGAELADRALAINPNLSYAWNARGFMSLILGEHERALREFANAMRLNPLDALAAPLCLFGSGAACLLLGRYEEGVGWCRRMLALLPNDIRGLYILTGCLTLSGRSSEAADAIGRIKRLYPQLRASQLRRTYRVTRPEDMAIAERAIAAIGLPE